MPKYKVGPSERRAAAVIAPRQTSSDVALSTFLPIGVWHGIKSDRTMIRDDTRQYMLAEQ